MAILSGVKTIKKVAREHRQSILAFSTGKNAVAAYLAIKDSFTHVYPYYLYLVPELEFVEKQLDLYERQFGIKITRLPHPALYQMLKAHVFQPLCNVAAIDEAQLEDFDYADIQKVMCRMFDLPPNTPVANGTRVEKNPKQRLSMLRHGSIVKSQCQYYPVWDWKKRDLLDCFTQHHVRLGSDYKVFGCSFDSLDLRFLLPIRQFYPRDYQKILEFFPLCELEIYRWECAHGKG
ncbi:MAG: phosphoadenosine phosphosulfate reductase [Snodgrassella sp.]|uniref:phosphoadenosine phosphosulfate reductase n=1 Tax=Snodgrassella sp. TaxID=2815304 RepID=UPI0025897B28|nr:phosphoadenosine phosphosulfate reductase [Snodgrassella sp.]MCO6522917.1 phosphoadenosine phosphosulfate reductase [Snodgrassella sp.]